MLKRIFLLLILGMMLVLPIRSLYAQEPVDPELLAYVSGAFDQMNALESYTLRGDQQVLIDAQLGMQHMNVTVNSTFEVQLQPAPGGNVRAADATVEGNAQMFSAGQDIEMHVFAEVIFLDLKQYFRLEIEAPPEVGMNFPDEWFVMDLSELEGVVDDDMGIEFELLAQASGNGFMTDFFVLVNDDTVKTMEENEAETIDGRDYRVFTVAIHPEGTIPDELTTFLDVTELQAQIEMSEGDSDVETAIMAQLRAMMDAITVSEQIWIDVETGLPQRIILEADYSEMLSMMGELDTEMAGTYGTMKKWSDVTIGDINAPFTAEPPENAIPIPASTMLGE